MEINLDMNFSCFLLVFNRIFIEFWGSDKAKNWGDREWDLRGGSARKTSVEQARWRL